MSKSADIVTLSGRVLRRGTTKEMVVEYLRREIVTGKLAPGARLNIKELATILGVSMTPIREALEQIAAEGLIRVDPYKGVWVSELTAEEYQEIFLMRVELEGLGHRLGAQSIAKTQITALEECLRYMAAATDERDVSTFLEHDRRFHMLICAASGRTGLVEKIMSLRRAAERYTRAAYLLPLGGMADTVRSHRKILQACRAHDGVKAEQLIKADLRITYESFAATYARTPRMGAGPDAAPGKAS